MQQANTNKIQAQQLEQARQLDKPRLEANHLDLAQQAEQQPQHQLGTWSSFEQLEAAPAVSSEDEEPSFVLRPPDRLGKRKIGSCPPLKRKWWLDQMPTFIGVQCFDCSMLQVQHRVCMMLVSDTVARQVQQRCKRPKFECKSSSLQLCCVHT